MGSLKHGVECTRDLFTQTKVAQCEFCVQYPAAAYIYKWDRWQGGGDNGWFTVFRLKGMPLLPLEEWLTYNFE